MKLSSLLFLSSLLLLSTACKEDKPDQGVQLPSNLRYEIEVLEEPQGKMLVEAQADGANYFSFVFHDKDGPQRFEAADGKAEYQFQSTGVYRIEIAAHTSFEHFVRLEDSLNIEIENNSGSGGIPTTGFTSPLSYPGYTLVWQDEFDGNQLSSDWRHEIGTGNNGWGNNELQYYRAENTEVRDGLLIITAKNESFQGQAFTSSRLVTQGQQSFKFGRIDIRAALPQGQGIWPALWMLGDNFPTAGWPFCGEIDIMEMVGGAGNNPNEGDRYVHGTLHWDNNGQYASFGGHYRRPNGIFAQSFHVFSIIWDAQRIQWFCDNVKYHEMAISGSALDEFRQEFFFIFNVAVGGNWPGSPDRTTVFPQQMAVDYVRVFQPE